MRNMALINASGVCINALATPNKGVTLKPENPGDVVVEITKEQFLANPVGRTYADGQFTGEKLNYDDVLREEGRMEVRQAVKEVLAAGTLTKETETALKDLGVLEESAIKEG